MEDPHDWNLLTSSLASSDLTDASIAWSFLVLQGLVRDLPGDRDRFVSIVAAVAAEGPVTGPSDALRIAMELLDAGLSLPRAEHPDPLAGTAEQRIRIVRQWRG